MPSPLFFLELWIEQAFNTVMHLEVLCPAFSTYVAELKIIQSGSKNKQKKGFFLAVGFVMV